MLYEEATGDQLDHLAMLYEVYSKPGEPRAIFRERVLMHMRAEGGDMSSLGVEKSFRAWKHVSVPAGIDCRLVVWAQFGRVKGIIVKVALWLLERCGVTVVS